MSPTRKPCVQVGKMKSPNGREKQDAAPLRSPPSLLLLLPQSTPTTIPLAHVRNQALDRALFVARMEYRRMF